MARKGENIRKRKDGRWEGRYRSGIKDDGTVKYTSVYGKSYTEVKNKLIELKRGIFCYDNNLYVEKRFADVLTLWLRANQLKVKGATQAKYSYMIEKHITPILGNRKVSALTVPIINDFLLDKMNNGRLDGRGGLSQSYVKTMAIIIESAMNFAVAEGYCQPLRNQIIKPSLVKKEMQILSVSAQQHFESLAATDINETITGIFIALYTGLRIGEVCALSWEDIDLENQIIHVRHTLSRIQISNGTCYETVLILDAPKTRASVRDIPISPLLLPILTYMKSRAVSKFVISTQQNFTSTRTFDYRYKKVLRDFDLPEINFHSLRHTFATRCVEVGVDVKSLSQMLGHSNVATTLNTYVHPSMDTMRVQIEKLQTVSVN